MNTCWLKNIYFNYNTYIYINVHEDDKGSIMNENAFGKVDNVSYYH